jgi:hypothetical protein
MTNISILKIQAPGLPIFLGNHARQQQRLHINDSDTDIDAGSGKGDIIAQIIIYTSNAISGFDGSTVRGL